MLGGSNSPMIFVSRHYHSPWVFNTFESKKVRQVCGYCDDPRDDDEEKTQPSTDKWGAADWLHNSSKSIHSY